MSGQDLPADYSDADRLVEDAEARLFEIMEIRKEKEGRRRELDEGIAECRRSENAIQTTIRMLKRHAPHPTGREG